MGTEAAGQQRPLDIFARALTVQLALGGSAAVAEAQLEQRVVQAAGVPTVVAGIEPLDGQLADLKAQRFAFCEDPVLSR